jgi:hypothetical protein
VHYPLNHRSLLAALCSRLRVLTDYSRYQCWTITKSRHVYGVIQPLVCGDTQRRATKPKSLTICGYNHCNPTERLFILCTCGKEFGIYENLLVSAFEKHYFAYVAVCLTCGKRTEGICGHVGGSLKVCNGDKMIIGWQFKSGQLGYGDIWEGGGEGEGRGKGGRDWGRRRRGERDEKGRKAGIGAQGESCLVISHC